MTVEVRQRFTLPRGSVAFRFSGHSDRGAVRSVNEDSFLARAPLFVVADGMGGHAFGDRASQSAVAAFTSGIREGEPADPQTVLDTIAHANAAVVDLSADAAPGAISGTTLTGVAFVDVGGTQNYHWMAFNVGDSRTYAWDGRALAQ
ncbi:MAG TPA: protein phosphatase 2C domain-containing protein, partial [Microbacterium sp.]|nr:protein phosphatase 2C domain-containing protein [Microbacterium sp.]